MPPHEWLGQTLSIEDFVLWNSDGEIYIRAEVRSSADVSDVVYYLQGIECEDVLREIAKIDFPIQLYTQKRLEERIASQARIAPMPAKIRKDQSKWIEIFQITEAFDRAMHLYLPHGRADLIPHPSMTYRCIAYGGGSTIPFALTYEEIGDGSVWQVTMVTSTGRTVGPRLPQRAD